MRSDILCDPAIPIPILVRVDYCLVFSTAQKRFLGFQIRGKTEWTAPGSERNQPSQKKCPA